MQIKNAMLDKMSNIDWERTNAIGPENCPEITMSGKFFCMNHEYKDEHSVAKHKTEWHKFMFQDESDDPYENDDGSGWWGVCEPEEAAHMLVREDGKMYLSIDEYELPSLAGDYPVSSFQEGFDLYDKMVYGG